MASKDRVGALYYEVILDPSKFARGATRVKAEQDAIKRAIKSTTSPLDKLQAEIDAVNAAFAKSSGRAKVALLKYKQRLVKDYAEMEAAIKSKAEAERWSMDTTTAVAHKNVTATQLLLMNYKKYGLSVKTVSKSIEGLSASMYGNLAQFLNLSPQLQGMFRLFGAGGLKILALVAALTAAYKAVKIMVGAADSAYRSMVRMKAAFGGSRLLAEEVRKELSQYASSTAYSTEQMMEFAVAMRTAGVSSGRIVESVKLFGNLAKGNTEDLKGLGKVWSQIMAEGVLRAEEAGQLTDRQVPIWGALAEILDKNVSQVRKMSAEGKVLASDVKKALEYLNEKQRLDEVNAEMMNSVQGVWNSIKQQVGEILAILGEPFRQALVDVLKVVNWWLIGLKQSVEYVKEIISYLDVFLVQGKAIKEIYDYFLGSEEALTEEQIKQRALEEEMTDEMNKQKRIQEEILAKRKETYDQIKKSLDDQLLTREQLENQKFEEDLENSDLTDAEKIKLRNRRREVQLILEARRLQELADKRRAEALEKYANRQIELAKKMAKMRKEAWEEQKKQAKDALKKQLDGLKEQRKMWQDRFKAAGGNIDEWERRQTQRAQIPTAASFSGGSSEEYKFLAQRYTNNIVQSREEVIAKRAEQQRDKNAKLLEDKLNDIAAQEQAINQKLEQILQLP
jgi:tape measure domain-containing protein